MVFPATNLIYIKLVVGDLSYKYNLHWETHKLSLMRLFSSN